MFEITQPTRRMDQFQPVRAIPVRKKKKPQLRAPILLALIVAYFIAPLRTNILLLGTDDSPERGSAGRTDTIILTTIVPLKPYVGMLSVPRDLWVNIPDVGEQRVNTAYFFSEAQQAGAGAEAAMDTIQQNFDVPVRYYVVIHMQGVIEVIDSLGGVDIELESAISGLSAGTHHLDGMGALMFARDRSMSDDFGRMAGAQTLISAVLKKALHPSSWVGLPQFTFAITQTVDTNIPPWQAPRLLFALARATSSGMDSRTITREMVTPFTTAGGAQVLLPNWEAINLTVKEMFGG